GEGQRDRGQRLLAARQERQALQALARRARHDVESGRERILIADPGECGLAAAKQAREQLGEMPVELVESGDEPLAPLLVESPDALAQPSDRRRQVGSLV